MCHQLRTSLALLEIANVRHPRLTEYITQNERGKLGRSFFAEHDHEEIHRFLAAGVWHHMWALIVEVFNLLGMLAWNVEVH